MGWLKKMMKVSIQEKLMEAKVEQLLHYREELALEENLPGNSSQLDENRLGALLLESPSCEKSSFVKNQIMKYVGWLRRTVQPSDSEVNMEFVMLPSINIILQVEMGLR